MLDFMESRVDHEDPSCDYRSPGSSIESLCNLSSPEITSHSKSIEVSPSREIDGVQEKYLFKKKPKENELFTHESALNPTTYEHENLLELKISSSLSF